MRRRSSSSPEPRESWPEWSKNSTRSPVRSGRQLISAPRSTDPALPIERKHGVLDELLEGRAARTTVSLIGFVANQGRLGDLAEIADYLSQRSAASQGKKVAEVRSAYELDDATVQRLAAALAKQAGGPVEVRTVIDPDIMGGIVARVGDVVIDGSVRSHLESLRQTLKAR